MSRFSVVRWLQAVARQSRHAPTKRRPAAGLRLPRFRPRLEALEDRTLPSTFTVTNLNAQVYEVFTVTRLHTLLTIRCRTSAS